MPLDKNKLRYLPLVIIVILLVMIAFVGGVYLGLSSKPDVVKVTDLFNKEPPAGTLPAGVDFAPFWKVWILVNEKYVASDNATSSSKATSTDQERVWGAISGLMASLGDPYSVFLPPAEKKKFEENIQGNFSGVGMEMGVKDGVPTVIAPLPDSPAKRAGIKSGDKILKVDSKLTTNLPIDEVIDQIRGPEGTTVILSVSREGVKIPFEIKIIRAVINIPTIKTEAVTDQKTNQKVFVITLYNFSAPSTNAFRGALREFILANTDKLVLDLRGNPGGYLEAAVDIASWFLPKGKVVVRENYSKTEGKKDYRSAGYNIFNGNLRMMVLVDRGSASAAEILAGALREYGVAKLVGEKTFGKGSVQELLPVADNSSIKITIARWFTPNGQSISQNGLDPDYPISITEKEILAGKDSQLNKAVELLVNGQ